MVCVCVRNETKHLLIKYLHLTYNFELNIEKSEECDYLFCLYRSVCKA